MKKIKNKTIRFKSIPINWHKENLNLKRNTIRKRDPKGPNDERFNILDRWITGKVEGLTVEIENTETGKYFSRKVLDVTLWDLNYIISW